MGERGTHQMTDRYYFFCIVLQIMNLIKNFKVSQFWFLNPSDKKIISILLYILFNDLKKSGVRI